MTSKERVEKALRRNEQPDRVPIEFDLCKDLLEYFSKDLSIDLHYTRSYYEDLTYRISGNEIRIKLGSDCVVVGAGLPKGYEHKRDSNGLIINEFGMKMRQGTLYMEVVESPLANIQSENEVADFKMPDPLADGRYDDAIYYINKYKNDYFIIGDVELTMFEMAWHLVGMEKFMIDIAMDESYVPKLLDKTMEFSLEVGKKLVEIGVDAIWTGDDFGAQNAMLISPKMWRDIFKPRYKELYEEFRNVNKDIIIIHHSDGAVEPILDDMIEIGVDVFNPVQPNVPGHEPEYLKNKYGDRLSFFGAIDQQRLLPRGTEEEIEIDVKEKIKILGRSGGYMIAPAHIIQADTAPEKVKFFIDTAKMYGTYKA